MKTEAQAIRAIQAACQAENEPTLSPNEITACLEKYARASVWTAETAYSIGAKVVPIAGNGRLYRCVRAGSSSASAPAEWDYTTNLGTCISDGQLLVWEDYGAAPIEIWDINAAIGEAWRLKASKDSALIDMSDKDTKIMITARRDFANKQAQRYVGTWVA